MLIIGNHLESITALANQGAAGKSGNAKENNFCKISITHKVGSWYYLISGYSP
jgi:hypothetical protein